MKKLPSAAEVNLGPVKISDEVKVIVSSDAGRTAVNEYLNDEGLGFTCFKDSFVNWPAVADDEPTHHESILMVDPRSLDERELGTRFEQTQATYLGLDADLDSQPTSRLNDENPKPLEFRHQLPTEPMSWGI